MRWLRLVAQKKRSEGEGKGKEEEGKEGKGEMEIKREALYIAQGLKEHLMG